MGFFNGMATVNRINQLLKDLENQVTISQGQIQSNASRFTLENSLNIHKKIHQELINAFANSATARVSVYKIFGEKLRMDDILMYSKNLIMNLTAILTKK